MLTSVRLSDFDFELPGELIAAYPREDRASARLLCVDPQSGSFSHHGFRDLVHFLKPGDLLVLNNTKVLPARIFGIKETGGKVEALLLREKGGGVWEGLLRPGGRVKKGAKLIFGENGTRLSAEVLDDSRQNSAERLIRFFDNVIPAKAGISATKMADPSAIFGGHLGQNGSLPEIFNRGSKLDPPVKPGDDKVKTFGDDNINTILQKIGHIPLPPYINRADSEIDRVHYQTVFAEKEGAVASPTAGLHFDEELLKQLKNLGVEIVYVTLHVSYGTFQSILTEDLSEHQMFEEEFEITANAAEVINRAKAKKRRVIACGTTSVRALESSVGANPCVRPVKGRHAGLPLQPQSGKTRLFIYPPYDFKIVDGLITNFHFPKSTLLLLVAAFLNSRVVGAIPAIYPAGKHESLLRLLQIYQEAIKEKYRFYSYGDAMLIL